MDSNTKVQKYLADLESPTDSSTSHKEGKMKTLRGPGQAAHDPLQFVALPPSSDMAERAKKLVTITEEQRRLREKELDSTPRLNNGEESWQADLDTWRKKRKNRLSSEETTTEKNYGSGGHKNVNNYVDTLERKEQTSRYDHPIASGYGSLERFDEKDYDVSSETVAATNYSTIDNVTSDDHSTSWQKTDSHRPSTEDYGIQNIYSVKTYSHHEEDVHFDYGSSEKYTENEHRITVTEAPSQREYVSEAYRHTERQRDAKEDILTIRSPSGEDHNNDSGIENRNSSSHSPSTSLDFSPRSADLISPKSHTFTSERSSSPPAPTYAPPPPPPSELDQVLIPVAASSHISRPAARDDPVDYPLPPEHLRSPSAERKKSRPSHSEELLSPTRARAFATYPAASSLREHTKVEPFVAQSIRDHNRSGDKSVLVELTVELNREQKAVVSATKYPATRTHYPNSSSVDSRDSRDSRDTRDVNSTAEPKSVSPTRYTSREPVYIPYKSQEFSSTRTSSQSRTTSSDSAKNQPLSRLHSVSTPNVAGAAATQPSTQPNMTSTVYRAVDIPFDDSAATYQPPKMNKDGLVCMIIEMGAQPVHKGFGFTVNCERRKCLVDGVIVGTPADKHGLLIGDRIDSINGESVVDKYPSAINRMLHEAARNGEVQLMVQRKDIRSLTGSTPNLNVYKTTATHKFDQTRNLFKDKSVDSYAEFKRKHTKGARESPSARDYSSLPRSSSSSTSQYESLPRRRDASANSSYRSARQSFDTLPSSHSGPDYKVTSLHEKAGPGKLTDFVPEVERQPSNDSFSTRRSYGSSEEARTIRNYEITSAKNESSSKVFKSRSDDSSLTVAMPTRSTLPRKSSSHHDELADDDTVPGKSYLRKNLRHLSISPSPPSILKRSRDLDDTERIYDTVSLESRREPFNYISPRSRYYHSTDDLASHHWVREDEAYAKPKTVHYHDIRLKSERQQAQERDQEHEQEFERMYRKKAYHTVGAYGTEGTPIPVDRTRTRYATMESPRPYSRARSSDHLQTREYRERREADISGVSHRFYDRDGNYVPRGPREIEHHIDIRREYGGERLPDSERYEEREKRMWIRDGVESRDWRDVINQQRQPAPGKSIDAQRIKEVTASMSNLPSIMDRKQEEIRRLQRENTDYQYRAVDRQDRHPVPPREIYERTEYGIYEKTYSPEPYVPQNYNSLRYSKPVENNYASNYEKETTSYNDYKRSTYNEPPRREHNTYQPQSTNYGEQRSAYTSQEANYKQQSSAYKEQNSTMKEQTSNYKEDIEREPENKESVVAISGKHRCAHCGDELGRGAAMIVESLGLYYHLACFKCYVCKTPLGSGTTGADVRVREGRLHCQSCYSNDRLQLSKV